MFGICEQKGFHIKFENGYTVSVQFGRGNYSDNYDFPEYGGKVPPSRTAEIAAFDPDGELIHIPSVGDNVEGWATPKRVLKFMNYVAGL